MRECVCMIVIDFLPCSSIPKSFERVENRKNEKDNEDCTAVKMYRRIIRNELNESIRIQRLEYTMKSEILRSMERLSPLQMGIIQTVVTNTRPRKCGNASRRIQWIILMKL